MRLIALKNNKPMAVKIKVLLAGFFKNIIEKNLIDGAVNGVGRLVGYGSRQLRLIQSGQVGNYLIIMVLAIVVFILIWFNDLTIVYYLTRLFKMA